MRVSVKWHDNVNQFQHSVGKHSMQVDAGYQRDIANNLAHPGKKQSFRISFRFTCHGTVQAHIDRVDLMLIYHRCNRRSDLINKALQIFRWNGSPGNTGRTHRRYKLDILFPSHYIHKAGNLSFCSLILFNHLRAMHLPEHRIICWKWIKRSRFLSHFGKKNIGHCKKLLDSRLGGDVSIVQSAGM